MAIGNKIAAARKKMNLTQDQLAEMLDVTRQSVSRWESETAYPETEKLVKLAKILELDLNYLLDDDATENDHHKEESRPSAEEERQRFGYGSGFSRFFGSAHYEYKSKRMVGKLPLVHVNIGMGGYKAKGIVAIGNISYGLVSIGLVSFGLLSIGLLAMGLLAFGLLAVAFAAIGTFALGVIAAGAICVGIFAFGAIAIGFMSFGAVSVGLFSCGALSYGKYIAIGDRAYADIAIGMTSAVGRLYESFSGVQNFFSYDKAEVLSVIDANVPAFWSWFIAIIKAIL